MKLKLTVLFAFSTFLLGCVPSTPSPQLQIEGQEVVALFSQPVEFLLRGTRGATNTPPTLKTVSFKFQCLRNFNGRSVQSRANASAQYASVVQNRTVSQVLINRSVFGWIREIEARSISEQGCEVFPQGSAKTVVFETVSQNPVAVMQFAARHSLF